MNVYSHILYYLSIIFYHNKSKIDKSNFDKISEEYAYRQYDLSLNRGLNLPISIRDKKILEIGCGHGGKCLFYSNNGASEVIGIDIDVDRLGYANKFLQELNINNVKFLQMDATNIRFDDKYFDLIFAPDVFEHFIDPNAVLKECFRLLKSGSKIAVNPVASIYNKDGAHLKRGIGLPWIYIFFSEKAICKALQKLSKRFPELKSYYPGLEGSPQRISELRKYNDLNYMTYKKMKKLAKINGFKIVYSKISPYPSIIGKIIYKIPIIKNTILADIFSKSATYIFEKK